jgi:tetratricopeptide (TPR) repeat protein
VTWPADIEALAGHLLELKVDEGLVAKARAVLTENAHDIGEWIELAVALRERGEYDAALATYDAAMARFPQSHVLWSNRGVLFLEWELYEEALRNFDKALEIEPEYVFAIRNIAKTRERLHEFEAAAVMYRRALELDPSHAVTWNSLGVCCRELGSEEEAIRCYTRSIELDPQFGDPLFNLAALLALRSEFDEAETWASRLVELAPLDSQARGLLEQIRERGAVRRMRPREAYVRRTDPRAPAGPRPRDRLYREDGTRIADADLVAEHGKIGVRLALLDDAIWRRWEAGEHSVHYPLRLFVSYKWGDDVENDRVARIADGLSARGWDVVFDRYRDETVDRSVEEFVSRIASCSVFFAVATPAFVAHGMNPVAEARWVFDEVQAAMSSELDLYRIALTPDGELRVPEREDDLLVRRSDTRDRFAPGMPAPGIPGLVTARVQELRFDEIHRIPDDHALDEWMDEHLTYRGPRLSEDGRSHVLAELTRAERDEEGAAALEALRELLRAYPFVAEAWRALVLRLTDAGRLDEAATALDQAAAHVHPWDTRLLLERERIDILNHLGRRLDAVKAALELIRVRPLDWVGHFYVGNHLDDCDDLWGARNHLLLACCDRFATAEAFNTLGVVYLGLGFLLRARQSFEQALERDATHERAARNLTRALDAQPPHALSDALRVSGPATGCTDCPAIYPLAEHSQVLCAECGGRRPALGPCPYCSFESVVPAVPDRIAVARFGCPTCRRGRLTMKDSIDI